MQSVAALHFPQKTTDEHVKWRVIFRLDGLCEPYRLPTVSVTPPWHSSLLADWCSAASVWHCWDSMTHMDLDTWAERYPVRDTSQSNGFYIHKCPRAKRSKQCHMEVHLHTVTHKHLETHSYFLGRIFVIFLNITQTIMGVVSLSKLKMRSVCNVFLKPICPQCF